MFYNAQLKKILYQEVLTWSKRDYLYIKNKLNELPLAYEIQVENLDTPAEIELCVCEDESEYIHLGFSIRKVDQKRWFFTKKDFENMSIIYYKDGSVEF